MQKENTFENFAFVPPHTKLSEDEIKDVLTKFNITKRQLPKIGKKDPAIQHLDIQQGDVIQILRDSPTSGTSFFYRLVI